MNVKSGVFRLGRWKCYVLMIMHYAPVVGVILLLATIGLITAGFIFSPWLGLAAVGFGAFIFVMVMSFIIFVYGFQSVTGCNMADHSLSLEDDRVKIEFGEGAPVDILKTDFLPYRIYPGGALVPMEGEKRGFLWVPPSAFDSDADFRVFLKEIYSGRQVP